MSNQAPETLHETPATTPAQTLIVADSIDDLIDARDAAYAAGESPIVVQLERVHGDGSRERVDEFAGADFTPFGIGRRFGAGNYIARLRVAHKYRKQARFSASAPAQTEPARAAAPFTPAPVPAPANADGTTSTMLAMMNGMMSMVGTVIAAVVSRPAQPDTSAELMKVIMPLIASREDKSDPAKLIQLGREMGAGIAPAPAKGRDDDEDEERGILGTIVHAATSAIADKMMDQEDKPAPAPQQQPQRPALPQAPQARVTSNVGAQTPMHVTVTHAGQTGAPITTPPKPPATPSAPAPAPLTSSGAGAGQRAKSAAKPAKPPAKKPRK